MQMKHLLIAFIVLLTLVGTASAAVSKVEIRSSIIHYDNAGANTNGFGTDLSDVYIDARSWAGLYFNLDSGVYTETLYLDYGVSNSQIDIYYVTEPAFQTYKFDWGKDLAGDKYGFAILGFFAEPYVALGNKDTTGTNYASNVNANKIAPLVINDKTKYTLKTGSSLDLGAGYSIFVDQIDVDGNKVYLKLFQDGKELNSSIVSTVGTDMSTAKTGGDWIFDQTVLNEKNMQVMRVHVQTVFQGTEDSLVEIDGLWLADYLNAFEVKSDVDYGKFNCTTAAKNQLKYKAVNVTLNADQSLDLGKGIYVKTEKKFDYNDASKDKFYFLKTYTEPGKYEIRSSVNYYNGGNGVVGYTYNFSNFAAFFYDIDKQVGTELMKLTVESNNQVLKSGGLNPCGLTYNTTPETVTYKYGWKDDTPAANAEKYYVMGFFGEKYVPLNTVNAHGTLTGMKADKMAKLVMDDDTKYTLKTGAVLELGSGYTIIVDQIDVDGNKAYLKFFSDGKEVNSSIINTKNEYSDWIFSDKVLGESNVQIIRIHVNDVFQGTQDSLVEIKGIWLMDYANASQIKADDKFGVFKCKGVISNVLEFTLDSNFTINSKMDMNIANNMYLKTADNTSTSPDGSRFYFYVAQEIEGGGSTVTPPETSPEEPSAPPENNTPPSNNTPERPTEPPAAKPSFLDQYMWYIIAAVVLVIIIAGVAYYFTVMKKK